MLYPVYIHVGDQNTAHGMTFPDFPGCFAAADEWQDIPHQAQEAVECHMAGEDVALPAPSPLPELIRNPDYQGGVWLLVDIDPDDAPELTDDFFEHADLYEGETLIRRGKPRLGTPKKPDGDEHET
jgi:predicted RNase H-like HicB family nuclease